MVLENDEKKHCPRCKSSLVKLHGKTKQSAIQGQTKYISYHSTNYWNIQITPCKT